MVGYALELFPRGLFETSRVCAITLACMPGLQPSAAGLKLARPATGPPCRLSPTLQHATLPVYDLRHIDTLIASRH